MSKRSSNAIFRETLSERKSQLRYDDEWTRFINYSELSMEPHVNDITEEMLAQYLDFLRNELEYAPTTIWSSFSKVNTKYQDIGGLKLQDKFPRLKNLLKRYQDGYVKKRADTFDYEQIKKFLENANDEGKNLLHKAVVCIALYGGLRCADLVNIENDDVTIDSTTGVWIKYSVSKQSGSFHKSNTFVIPPPHDKYVIDYLNATNRLGRIFKNFNNKFTAQPMGVRTLALTPSVVAKYLGLQGNFTGHCFRRSCATILAENGATSTQLKSLMNWRGEATALNYVDNSKRSRIVMAEKINGESQLQSNNTSDCAPKFENVSFTNCVFNFGKL